MMDTGPGPDASDRGVPSTVKHLLDETDAFKAQQHVRFQRALFAAINYTLVACYTAYLVLSDQIDLDLWAAVSVFGAVIGVYSVILWLIATERNRHLSDPSVTTPQQLLANGVMITLFAFAHTLFAQDLYFFAFLMTLLFGAFRLNLKRILVTKVPAFAGFAIIMLSHSPMMHETLSTAAERVGIYGVSMGWMVLFAMSINQLRQTLASRNQELKAALRQLRDVASRDELTGVHNRRYFFETLEREVERSKRSGDPLSVGMLDIDHFKTINDTYGHQAGDKILCELIRRTRDSIRGGDALTNHVLSRYGGEEFLITLPLTPIDGAHQCAERVLEAIRESPFTTEAGPINVSASFGMAQYQGAEDTIDALISRVDWALYQAKTNGRDQVATDNALPTTV